MIFFALAQQPLLIIIILLITLVLREGDIGVTQADNIITLILFVGLRRAGDHCIDLLRLLQFC